MLTKFLKVQLLVVFMISSGVFAQQVVSGSITDQDGNPLPGATVIIQGTDTGVSTDFDGNYSIQVERGQTLEVSYIGYQVTTVVVGDQNQINLSLAADNELEEVVIIGYGAVRKKDLTGTLDVVGSEDFTKGSVVSAQQLIQGKVAGVSIVSNSGAPGDGANVLIRGIGSLNLNSNPLYVVDGIPLDSGGVGGSRNALNVINPNDIASMTVLKDASATAIYGSRAANGVILITTKKGQTGEIAFEFSSRATSFNPINKINVLNAAEFTSAVQATNDAYIISRLGTDDTDWQDEIYDQAFGINSTFSASGALKGVPFRVSLCHTDQEGILMGDNFSRTTGSLNVSPQFLDGALRVNLNTRYVFTQNDFANRGAIGSAAFFDPTKPVFDANSPFANYYTWLDADGSKLALSPTNPLALLNLTDDESDVNRVIANVKVDYDLPVDGLTATINAGVDNSTGEGISSQDANLPTDADGFNGSSNNYYNTSTNLLFDAYVNYLKTFETSNFSLTAGHSYQSFEYDNSSS